MYLRKGREPAIGGSTKGVRPQPSYHSEIDGVYLDALQRQVDLSKPKNFALTPLSDAGW